MSTKLGNCFHLINKIFLNKNLEPRGSKSLEISSKKCLYKENLKKKYFSKKKCNDIEQTAIGFEPGFLVFKTNWFEIYDFFMIFYDNFHLNLNIFVQEAAIELPLT